MREIKFRVWDAFNKIWLNRSAFSVNGHGFLYNIEEKQWEAVINKDYNANRDSHIIQQYTALKDKNGKEIYEGDIVKMEWESRKSNTKHYPVGIIKYKSGCFVWEPLEERMHDESYDCVNWWEVVLRGEEFDGRITTSPIEVIGNIFENKDLL